VAADHYRRDLAIKGIHPTGHAGFVAALGSIAPNSVVRCRVHGTELDLSQSPLTVV
jgi:hypothetical protein